MRAAPLQLDTRLSVEEVLRAAAHAALQHLLRNEAAARAGEPDGIHQMRVAVRRLRAILSAFAPVLPKGQRRWASGELKWFADMLSDARNLDVFTQSLLAPSRVAVRVDAAFERLALAAERRRRATRAQVAAAIASPLFTERLLTLLRWFEHGDWLSGSDELHQPISTIGWALLERCRRKVARRAKGVAHQSPKERHRLRIALKRLRYTAELLSGLYDAAESRPFIRRLKRLQDDLGDANDLRVAREIVKALAGRGHHSAAIARAARRVLAWRKRRLDKNEHDLRRHLDALLETRPFWRP